MTVTVQWLNRDGTPGHFFTYWNVLNVDESGDRLILTFEKYKLWLFTQHMATAQIEEAPA